MMSQESNSPGVRGPGSAFECWHFDALSDDGREALVITFNDNYPYSPRYFRESKRGYTAMDASERRFPAVTFTYSVNGRIVLRAVNEFRSSDFSARRNGTDCSIGSSSFQLYAADYGSGIVIKLDLLTARKCRIEAEIEWLSIEPGKNEPIDGNKNGTIFSPDVEPRSDVSGRITRISRRGRTTKTYAFRGTGFHDHFRCDRPLGELIDARWWGRAHFVDSTAIFRCHQKKPREAFESTLFLVRDGSVHERTVVTEVQNVIRDRYGLTVPGRLSFLSDDNIRLRVKPSSVIESGFFKKSVVSEMTLMLRDGKPRKTTGIVEFIAPGRLTNPLFRWFTDLRIGRNGKWPWF